MRSSACDAWVRPSVRDAPCWLAFPLAPALGSTNSAAGFPALFAGFIATTARPDFSRPCIIGFGSESLPDADQDGQWPVVKRETSQVPTRSFRA